MKNIKVSFDTWVQLLGMLGVLGGLIFVGLEMRQNYEIALGNQHQGRTELRAALLMSPLEGNIDAVKVEFLDWEEQTEEQKQITIQIQRFRWALLENLFFQYNLGLISEGVWRQTEGNIRRYYDRCELRDAITLSLSNPAFQEYVNSFPNKCAE
uniref:Uncharacterized protein n=1 Tax=uncultured Oceanospirillales bacterium HF0130_25G24 TaxID=710744 RepID=E0XTG2_9GAMM|nr:hypothetical protein [uncultured Oceanospirillales bacterium HF0130_25G24]